MRAFAIAVVGISMVSSHAWAQDCKPDVTRQDRITNERVDIWLQDLVKTSFGASLLSTSELRITATVGRYGDRNAVNLQIEKKDSIPSLSFKRQARSQTELNSCGASATGSPRQPQLPARITSIRRREVSGSRLKHVQARTVRRPPPRCPCDRSSAVGAGP